MLELILLIFLSRAIGKMAVQRGLSPSSWKIKTILYWIICEFLGIFAAMEFLHFTAQNIVQVSMIGLLSGFGGYLIVRKQLEKIDIVNSD